jgi:nicotinamide riboside transporter PnuC
MARFLKAPLAGENGREKGWTRTGCSVSTMAMKRKRYRPASDYSLILLVMVLAILNFTSASSLAILTCIGLFLLIMFVVDWRKSTSKANAQKTRPLFQIHLSTALLLMLFGSALVPLNIKGWYEGNFSITILVTINLLLLFCLVCEAFIRQRDSHSKI